MLGRRRAAAPPRTRPGLQPASKPETRIEAGDTRAVSLISESTGTVGTVSRRDHGTTWVTAGSGLPASKPETRIEAGDTRAVSLISESTGTVGTVSRRDHGTTWVTAGSGLGRGQTNPKVSCRPCGGASPL